MWLKRRDFCKVYIEKLRAIWPEWNIESEIGRGAYGVVYKAIRAGHGVVSYAAIKVISIPKNEAEIKSLRTDGLDEAAIRNYFSRKVSSTVNEIKVLESMKGHSNIVSVEDYMVLPHANGIGSDIFIRMELLKSFVDYLAEKQMKESDVIKLGLDISSALELCAKRNIIHRDIKPENIFVSSFGDYKIGDFGIARKMEESTGPLSVSGTQNYMAPEIQSKHYDGSVDIYATGLVLYKLLNNNRLPFLNPHAQFINPEDYQAAIDRRFAGESFPNPVNASPQMAYILKMACAFDPKKRFRTPTAFKKALESLSGVTSSANQASTVSQPAQPQKQFDPDSTQVLESAPPIGNAAIPPYNNQAPNNQIPNNQAQQQNRYEQPQASPQKKKGFNPLFVVIPVIVCVLGVGGFFGIRALGDGGLDNLFGSKDDEGTVTHLTQPDDEKRGSAKGDSESELIDRLDGIYDDYLDGKIGYEEAMQELDEIEGMGNDSISNKLSNIKSSIERIDNSEYHFQNAEALLASGKYPDAIGEYSLVAEESPRYEQATKGISDAKNAFNSVNFFLPNSDSVRLTASDLEGMSLAEMKIARNEIFARKGRQFADEFLNNWFSSKSWYTPRYTPDEFSNLPSPFSDLELDNINYILSVEDSWKNGTVIFPQALETGLSEIDIWLTDDLLIRARSEIYSMASVPEGEFEKLPEIAQRNERLITAWLNREIRIY